jgi:hypothetical protein
LLADENLSPWIRIPCLVRAGSYASALELARQGKLDSIPVFWGRLNLRDCESQASGSLVEVKHIMRLVAAGTTQQR